jgi:hypothetical protein
VVAGQESPANRLVLAGPRRPLGDGLPKSDNNASLCALRAHARQDVHSGLLSTRQTVCVDLHRDDRMRVAEPRSRSGVKDSDLESEGGGYWMRLGPDGDPVRRARHREGFSPRRTLVRVARCLVLRAICGAEASGKGRRAKTPPLTCSMRRSRFRP